jgi:hypothetical protein
LPHSFGWGRTGYTCGSLFVDHASGKIFNFSQYSNTADETIKSVMKLEAMAHDEGFKIKNTTQIMAFFLRLISKHTATISKQNILLAELGQNI